MPARHPFPPRPPARAVAVAAVAFVMLAAAACARGATALELARVTPSGDDVPAGRQIVFRFDRPMVPLGRMARERHEIPVRIAPRLDCRWRWLDVRTLACELAPQDALAPATRYRIVMEPGLRALDGSMLAAAVEHRFTTLRPQVAWVAFETWLAPQRPVLKVMFNQPVTRDSVRASMDFVTPGAGPAPLRVAAVHADGLAVLDGDASPARIASAALRASAPARSWLVTPAAALPADAPTALAVRPGLVAAGGPEPGIERRSVSAFHTFPPLRFLGVRCSGVSDGKPVELAPASGAAAPGPCDPLARVALLFSAPVPVASVRDAVTVTPALRGGGESGDGPWDSAVDWLDLGRAHAQGQRYAVWFPEHLQAFRHYRAESAPGALHDAFGRALEDGFAMDFGTAHRRPRLVLAHPESVLELGVDSEVPLYVTNLDAVDVSFRRHGRIGTHARRIPVPAAEDVSFALPLGVRALLDGASGAVSGELRPVPAGADHDGRHFFAQVTPFAVTVKLGHFSSIAWITRMDTGEAVAGARLTVYRDRYDTLSGPGPGATGPFVTAANGVARLPGTAVLDSGLDLLDNWRRDQPRLFVDVRADGERALLPLDGDFRIWTRDVWPAQHRAYGHLRAWGTTAQGLYRAGDTIQYKIYVRHQDTRALTPAPREGYRLRVVDPKGEPLLDGLDVTLNAFGAFDGELAVPRDAAVGWYRFVLHSRHGNHEVQAFRVLVSDFTPAPFKVLSELNGERFEAGDRLAVTTTAALHAGGPYTGAAARVTVRVRPRPLSPEHPVARGFRFTTGDQGRGWQVLRQDTRALDARGLRVTELDLDEVGIEHGVLEVESAVRDDRGGRVAATVRAGYTGRDRFVGLRDTSWVHEAGELARVDWLVVDARGEPAAGTAAQVSVEREQVYAARVKGAGNAYQRRYERRWERVAGCAGRSRAEPAACVFVPPRAGRYRLVARIEDTLGRPQRSVLHTWVTGAGRVTWAEPDDGALSLTPDRSRYGVGDTVRVLVRNPFPGALALVTLERYGVLRSWTRRLEGSTPVLEFPVEPDHIPGVFLSVQVLSPRVAAPPPARGQVDLGKPAARIGYLRLPVDDPWKRLDVTVRAGQAVYRPRETAALHFEVRRHDDGAVPQAPVELAVAVLDEAVFDLVDGGSRTFDPYAGFHDRFDLDVVSYALLTRLVGRQKFERKGADSGGDGGAGPGLRDLFRFVSYWNPSLPVDAGGGARVEVPLPDNLTRWRVLALAVTPGDRMGLGEGGFRVNKDTELRAVMPNQVTAGDRFRAGFTVLNRSDGARRLAVTLTARGDALAADAGRTVTLDVAPFERATAWLELDTTAEGRIEFEATAADARDADRLRHHLSVRARTAFTTAATMGVLDGAGDGVDVAVPAAAVPGAGALSLLLSPSLLGNADGAFRHMRDYPYACWEQRLSKAVMASHYARLREFLDPALHWPGADSLPLDTLEAASRFQAPNGAMSFWVASDARASPYLSAYTALAFGWLERTGLRLPARVVSRLEDYLSTLLRKDVLPEFFDRGMASSVRAVALDALARRGAASAEDVLRHRPHLAHMSVFAKAHYLDAAWRLLGRHPAVDEAVAALLAHGQESAGRIAFSEDVDAGGAHLLATPARANCAALSALTALASDPALRGTVRPLLPKLVRTVTGERGRRDHWENTQENVFCMGALADYAQAFEADAPALTVRARLDGEMLGEARFDGRRDPAVTLERPLADGDPGATRRLALERDGTGRVYWTARLRYALAEAAAERTVAGMSLRREYSVQRDGAWTLLASPMQVRRGDLVRVDLYLSLPTARHFVVVDDPVPGGLEPVNRALATASRLDAGAGDFQAAGGSFWHSRDGWRGFGSGYWSFYHRELRHDAARFFSDYLPAGDYHLSYTAQAIAAGRFLVQPAHAEEMYDPDVLADGLPATLVVAEDAAP